ncbi:MAG TPA: alpha/beta hydrolase domain-containing protein [Spirillospora sp.]|nr:alpha/beta hydrolase domain-containing protein [Spirillospora sp.]
MDVRLVDGPPSLISTFFDLGRSGYTAAEFFASGEAAAYEAASATGDDGVWTVRPARRAPFTTRLVVYRPADPAAFGGTVVVEWLNVSSGADAPAFWLNTHRQLVRDGAAWIGVSAQRDSIDGESLFSRLTATEGDFSSITLPPLKTTDPERYASLDHPGNAFSFDIFAQVGRLAREEGGVLGPLRASRVLAAGQSQSAAHLVTFVNAVAPVAGTYDGYLIHGRPGGPALLDGARWESRAGRVRIRADGDAPVITVQSETDVAGLLRSAGSRQPDGERFRLWEVAGAAHADTYTIDAAFRDSGRRRPDELAAMLAPRSAPLGAEFPLPINSGPQQHYVAQAAVAALDRWVRTGEPPASADRLDLEPGEPVRLRLDGHGIAAGGVRTPWVDVPVAVLSGLGQEAAPGAALLFGSTRPFGAATLRRLYPRGADDYVPAFRAAAERAVAAGFLLAADLDEAVGVAAASFPS